MRRRVSEEGERGGKLDLHLPSISLLAPPRASPFTARPPTLQDEARARAREGCDPDKLFERKRERESKTRRHLSRN